VSRPGQLAAFGEPGVDFADVTLAEAVAFVVVEASLDAGDAGG
jgi:hypothetical protein